MRLLAAILSVLLLGALARGDDLPAAGSLSAAGAGRGESHGWIAIPLDDPAGGGAIVHLPPRRAADRTDTIDDAFDGGVRLALRLPRMPERLAAWGDQLWIVFPPESLTGGRRRVLSMSVERSALGGAWSSPESEGRLPSLPQLPGDRSLEGFVGSTSGPVALLRDPSTLEFTLLRLEGNEWVLVDLSADIVTGMGPGIGRESTLLLVCDPDGFALISPRAEGVWHGRVLDRESDRGPSGASVEWTKTPLSFRTDSGGPGPRSRSPLVLSGGHLVYSAPGRNGSVELWSPGPSACRRLATIPGVTTFRALVPLDQVGRVALVWLERPKQDPAPKGSIGSASQAGFTTHIAEVSALTGAVLYEGPARIAGPVSAAELKFLAVVLVGVMVVVLLFVLRPDENGPALTLPTGFALAEPGRRVIAGAIDLFLAVSVAAAILGVPVGQLLSPGSLLYDPAGLQTMVMILGLGIAHSTVLEWLLGASIGKLITRCRVVRVVIARGPDSTPLIVGPGLWRALVRNVVRWTLAPVAITGLNAPDHRHRGDLAAGTVVVVRLTPGPT